MRPSDIHRGHIEESLWTGALATVLVSLGAGLSVANALLLSAGASGLA